MQNPTTTKAPEPKLTGRKHTERRAIATLNLKHDCHVSADAITLESNGRIFKAVPGRTIQILRGTDKNGNPLQANDLGNRSHGKIDFLRRSGFRVMFTDKIIRKGARQ